MKKERQFPYNTILLFPEQMDMSLFGSFPARPCTVLFNEFLHPFREAFQFLTKPRLHPMHTNFTVPQVIILYGLLGSIADAHDCRHLYLKGFVDLP